MRMLHISFLICFAVALVSHGQHKNAASTAFPILNINSDARSTALGGASVGIPNDLYGINSNPSSLGFINGSQFMIGFRPIVLDIWMSPVGYAKKVGKNVFAGNMVGLSGGEFEVTEADYVGSPVFVPNKEAAHNTAVLSLAWAQKVADDIAFGVAMKGTYDRLGTSDQFYTANAIMFDLGVQYRLLNDYFITGLAIRQLGLMLDTYKDERYPLPVSLDAGISYVPRYVPNARFIFDISKKLADYLKLKPALEINLFENALTARAGIPVTIKDIEGFFEKFALDDESESESDFTKSNWQMFSFGLGVKSSIDNLKINADLGVEVHSDLPLAVVASCLIGF